MKEQIPTQLVAEILWQIRHDIFGALDHVDASRTVGYIDRWIKALASPEPEQRDD